MGTYTRFHAPKEVGRERERQREREVFYLLFEEDINVLTDSIKEVVQETAREVLDKKGKIQPWITNDILDLCDTRRNIKKTKNSTFETTEQYRTVNDTIRTEMIKAKEKCNSEQCDNIEKGIKESNNKKAFDTMKKLTRKQQHKATVIEDKNGSLLTDNAPVLTRWTEYCQELYNYELINPIILLSFEAAISALIVIPKYIVCIQVPVFCM